MEELVGGGLGNNRVITCNLTIFFFFWPLDEFPWIPRLALFATTHERVLPFLFTV